MASPKPGGYRAKHVIVVDALMKVEIQLRTARQNKWADEVEEAADRLGYRLKEALGPSELVEYFEVAAALLATEDQSVEPNADLRDRLAALRGKVHGYFEREQNG